MDAQGSRAGARMQKLQRVFPAKGIQVDGGRLAVAPGQRALVKTDRRFAR